VSRLLSSRNPDVPLEALRIEKMANGWDSILLTEQIGYEEVFSCDAHREPEAKSTVIPRISPLSYLGEVGPT
jgi:hypothetical protein